MLIINYLCNWAGANCVRKCNSDCTVMIQFFEAKVLSIKSGLFIVNRFDNFLKLSNLN
jgi:hypothetical protein